MSKYDPLCKLLKRQVANTIILSFQEIEKIIGVKLPPSSNQRQWWENSTDLKKSGHTQVKSWVTAGFHVDSVDFDSDKIENSVVTFRR